MRVLKSLHFSSTPLQQLHKPIFPIQSSSQLLKKPTPIGHSQTQQSPLLSVLHEPRTRLFVTSCASPTQEAAVSSNETENNERVSLVSGFEEEDEEEAEIEETRSGGSVLENQSIWQQMKEILMFTGPATGLWICGPLMSLIDTAVIGQGSSLELAALGPGTVLCDNMSYVFMFLSIATSNMVATSLAKQDKKKVQHQLSILLFIGLTCGFLMFLITKFCGPSLLTAFIGSSNLNLVPAANTYVQIRALAWPALLIGWVAQSASLGMKDSWGPLKALAFASAINGIGDVVLCMFFNYGIAGAAWATMASQVVAGYMMINSLNKKGCDAYAISIPSLADLITIFELAAPVFVVMMSKVAFYTLLVYVATSMGTLTLAAHQVMIQAFLMCTVWGEPLSQTAQSFMPEFLYGKSRNVEKAQMLLKSLAITGTIIGLLLGIVGTSVPWLLPTIFTADRLVIHEMHKVLIPFFLALAVTPCTVSLEGTLLAARDLKFISLSMSGCFCIAALALLHVSSRSYGFQASWYALAGFQWARFSLALQRLLSPTGLLFAKDSSHYDVTKVKAT